MDELIGCITIQSNIYHPLTEDVEGLRLLALADGVADLALDDGAVLAPVEPVQPQLRPVVPRHDGVRQEPPERGTFRSLSWEPCITRLSTINSLVQGDNSQR